MSKENELLEKKILDKIDDVRYMRPEKKKDTKSIFYLLIVFFVALSIIFSLLRFF